MNDEFGVMYIATGKQFVSEAIQSATSLKKVMPDIPIILWTDQSLEVSASPFNSTFKIDHPRHSFFDKIKPLCETPFQKTLFIDTDTYFLEPVYELIPLLDRFEFAYCHAPWRVCPGENNILEEVPDGFPEPNSGVIAYRSTKQVFQTIRNWEKIYDKKLNSDNVPDGDQSALRLALWKSEINTTILPPEYNIRTPFPVFVGGNSAVKILHGRDPSLGEAKRRILDKDGIRVYDFKVPGTFLGRTRRKLSKILNIITE